MLTGRKDAFLYEEHYDDVSGYSNPGGESEHDHFTIGHTSTSISLALGLAKARDLKEENGKCDRSDRRWIFKWRGSIRRS